MKTLPYSRNTNYQNHLPRSIVIKTYKKDPSFYNIPIKPARIASILPPILHTSKRCKNILHLLNLRKVMTKYLYIVLRMGYKMHRSPGRMHANALPAVELPKPLVPIPYLFHWTVQQTFPSLITIVPEILPACPWGIPCYL